MDGWQRLYTCLPDEYSTPANSRVTFGTADAPPLVSLLSSANLPPALPRFWLAPLPLPPVKRIRSGAETTHPDQSRPPRPYLTKQQQSSKVSVDGRRSGIVDGSLTIYLSHTSVSLPLPRYTDLNGPMEILFALT